MSDPVNTGGEAAPGDEATSTPFAPADAGALGGRVEPGHGEISDYVSVCPTVGR